MRSAPTSTNAINNAPPSNSSNESDIKTACRTRWSLDPEKTVVSLGCGQATELITLPNRYPGIKYVGIDIDEVKADLMNPLINFHNFYYGTSLSRNDFKTFNLWETWGGTEYQTKRKVKEFFRSNYFENIQPINNSQKAIDFLRKNHDLFVITSRPDYIRDKTTSWINNYFPNCYSGLYFTSEWSKNGDLKKEQVCSELGIDFLIEDSFENAINCALNQTKVLLMDCPWNQKENLPKNITRVINWDNVLDILENGSLK